VLVILQNQNKTCGVFMKTRLFIALLLLIQIPTIALAEPCSKDDFETKVTGVSQCLLMRRYGAMEPNTMIVWLHGDISSGDPANYHFPLAQKAAEELAAIKVMSVALVRPGYPDGTGESSSVSNSHSGRSDHYTQENIGEVGGAIEKLRHKYKPKSVIIVGHSGGAATTALLLGMKPKLADAGVLVACPCDIVEQKRKSD
jgi:poly(3-hydroxybutyrate) depolymerase